MSPRQGWKKFVLASGPKIFRNFQKKNPPPWRWREKKKKIIIIHPYPNFLPPQWKSTSVSVREQLFINPQNSVKRSSCCNSLWASFLTETGTYQAPFLLSTGCNLFKISCPCWALTFWIISRMIITVGVPTIFTTFSAQNKQLDEFWCSPEVKRQWPMKWHISHSYLKNRTNYNTCYCLLVKHRELTGSKVPARYYLLTHHIRPGMTNTSPTLYCICWVIFLVWWRGYPTRYDKYLLVWWRGWTMPLQSLYSDN